MLGFDQHLHEVRHGFERLQEANVAEKIDAALELIVPALSQQRPLLVCGNGGSAADALHISGELVGRFLLERRALNVLCLSANVSAMTAWANDYDYESIFARQVEAHGTEGAILLCISTSGNSKNILKALETARDLHLATIGLTGQGGGGMATLCDVLIDVPSRSTPRVQEMHLVVYHYLCERIEWALANVLPSVSLERY
ncbi:MAG: SIS domain-containing protein [Candidatus Tectimicrobiota bacterium]